MLFNYEQTRLTVCEGRDGTESSNGDILIFPDMIKYRSILLLLVLNFFFSPKFALFLWFLGMDLLIDAGASRILMWIVLSKMYL